MSGRMKVLHLHSGNMYGGVETLLATLARYREQCPALEQDFALCFDGRIADELREAGAAVTLLGTARLSRPWTLHRVRNELKAIVAEQAYDVVICHSAWSQEVFGPAVSPTNAHLVLWQHSAGKKSHWLERLARRTRPDMAVANSRFTATLLTAREPALPVEVLYPPVAPPPPQTDAGLRDRVRQALNTPSDAVVILQISRMEAWKGQMVHLRALGRLRDVPNWVCWQVGGPQRPAELRYFDSLKAEAAAFGIEERVRFLGQRSDTADLYGSADLFCQPNSGPEPFGIVFVEALYAGLAVITSDFGGGAEIVDRSCGILVRPNDPAALAAALRDLLTGNELRQRLGGAGPDRARALCEPAGQVNELYAILSRRFGRRP